MKVLSTLAAVLAIALACCAGRAWAVPVPPGAPGAAGMATSAARIISPTDASGLEKLAAKEVRRYAYLCTGRLLEIVAGDSLPAGGDVIVVGRKDRAIARAAAPPGAIDSLAPQQYVLKSIAQGGRRVALVVGGDDVGALYAAYGFAAAQGVRFYLHGDTVPDGMRELRLDSLNERAQPLFELRGIQPFHDFPEGPDWWTADDYKAILSQLAKLRMNFIGLHTYPEGGVGPEPTVWIGLPQDFFTHTHTDADGGRVRFAYPSRHFNTLLTAWGYRGKRTSDYLFGASELFDRDDFGPDAMRGMCPVPATPEACAELFGRFGELLREAFTHARSLGIRTCVGTETPLIVPRAVRERLKALGKNAADPAVVEELYEGVFRRIAAAYPIDYYWFWTPEGWTWGGVKDEQIKRTIDDLNAAVAAAKKAKAPFALATCGWVLGPPQDRALFDKVLPKDIAVSCINRSVGKSPVEPGFQHVAARGKWAIPWLEDDPAMIVPQLWAGRMRKDAADALRYGCTGLMGIHWRTRVLGPNVRALAEAAWDQSAWSRPATAPVTAPAGPPASDAAVGGKFAAFPNAAIADTDDDTLYQTVRYDVEAYRLAVPNGTYTVKLQFCEPHYGEKDKRIFGVKVQGKQVIEGLDIFARVGKNKALDYTFGDVAVTNGRLDIEFTPQVEFPCIAAIALQGKDFRRKINCGGPAYKDYAADLPPGESPDRFAPVQDFYADWAATEFGPDVAGQAAAIFSALDGRLPCPADWVDGPGGIRPDKTPWDQAQKAYAFVDDFAALRPLVKGAGNAERFDYWLSSFQYLRAVGRLRCIWATGDAKALEDALRDVYGHLLATVSTPGEMGTVANWDQHILPMLKIAPTQRQYAGKPRLIVPTVRTTLAAGEDLRLKAIVLAPARPALRQAQTSASSDFGELSRAVEPGGLSLSKAADVTLHWRPMGAGEFTKAAMTHVARGVYSATIPAATIAGRDFEYYIRAAVNGGEIFLPATAPQRGQTVVTN